MAVEEPTAFFSTHSFTPCAQAFGIAAVITRWDGTGISLDGLRVNRRLLTKRAKI